MTTDTITKCDVDTYIYSQQSILQPRAACECDTGSARAPLHTFEYTRPVLNYTLR